MADAMFDDLVRDALDGLPEWVTPYLEDVVIQVVDRPDPEVNPYTGEPGVVIERIELLDKTGGKSDFHRA